MTYYIIGTDEAGYGPNLGPLTIAVTFWKMKSDANNDFSTPRSGTLNDPVSDFVQRFSSFTAATPRELTLSGKKIVIGDSKKIYQTGKINALAKTVMPSFFLLKKTCDTWKQLLEHLAAIDSPDLTGNVTTSNIDSLIATFAIDYCCAPTMVSFKNNLSAAGVDLCNIQSRIITPKRFNADLEKFKLKSNILTHYTMSLIARTIEEVPKDENACVIVCCDKHGGRNYYVDILYEWFSEVGWIEIVKESDSISVYRFKNNRTTIEFRFMSKGDQHIPIALASMVAKFLRELAMYEFNYFWKSLVPKIKPTAGYPADAVRFFAQINEVSENAGISKSEIWREK